MLEVISAVLGETAGGYAYWDDRGIIQGKFN